MSELTREKLWPYLASVVVSGAWYFCLQHHFPDPDDNLMLATGTAAAVLIGFLATAKAIVLGLTGSPVFQAIKSTGYTAVLFRYFFEAIVFGSAALAISIAGFFLPNPAPTWFAVSWVLIATTAIFDYLRVVQVLFTLISKA